MSFYRQRYRPFSYRLLTTRERLERRRAVLPPFRFTGNGTVEMLLDGAWRKLSDPQVNRLSTGGWTLEESLAAGFPAED